MQERPGQTSYGTSNYVVVAGLGLGPAKAHATAKVADGGNIADIGDLGAEEWAVLRQINPTPGASAIADIRAGTVDEPRNAQRLSGRGNGPARTDWNDLDPKMDDARMTDRVTIAGRVAAAFGPASQDAEPCRPLASGIRRDRS